MNIFNKALQDFEKADRLRKVAAWEDLPNKFITKDGKKFLNLASNNYLGLANHPEIKKAAAEAALNFGTSAGGSRLLGGGLSLHSELEEAISAYRPLGKALLFNTGFMANSGALPALAALLGPIYSDKLNHASLVDGMLMSKGAGEFHRYRHGDMDHLELLLKSHSKIGGEVGKNSSENFTGKEKPGIVCTETLFSMDGDFAPLQKLLELQSRYGFFLYLDEAHSTGGYPDLLKVCIESALRPNSKSEAVKGSSDTNTNPYADRLILMGTFGKAFGSFGAYLSASESAIDYLVNTARSFIFSTALPPSTVAANLAALQIVQKETWRSEKLQVAGYEARKQFKANGLDIGCSESHIVPVLVGSNANAIKLSEALYHAGYHAPAIRYPTVPEGKARLRINMTAEMEISEIHSLAETVGRCMRDLSLG